MKSKIYLLLAVIVAVSFTFSSCKKSKTETQPETPYVPLPAAWSMAGVGSHVGFPTGPTFHLPSNVRIIGSIRGGIQGKDIQVNKDTYKGPFSYKILVDTNIYGTGTFINLYAKLYNSLPTIYNLSVPGGLIFCDSLDLVDSVGVYQKGLILQTLSIPLAAQDTTLVHIKAYCLNHTLAPSSYNAVYYIGPVSNIPDLNTIVTIMASKQPPFGEEYNIQSKVWKVTDYGQVLDSTDLSYLNSLP
jgi:hypothetical protein